MAITGRTSPTSVESQADERSKSHKKCSQNPSGGRPAAVLPGSVPPPGAPSVKALRAALLAVISAALTAALVSGCRGAVPVRCSALAGGAIAGFSAEYADELEMLAGSRQAAVITAPHEWAALRDLLNAGAGLQLYGHLELDEFVIVAYFAGPAGPGGWTAGLESAAVRGNEVEITFRTGAGTGDAAAGYGYQLVAVTKADLWPETAAQKPRRFVFSICEGRSRVAAVEVELSPPSGAAPADDRPDLRVIGPGIPEAWAPGGEAIVVGAREAGGPGAAHGLSCVPLWRPDDWSSLCSPERGTAGGARFSPDGSLLAFVVAEDRRFRLFVAAAGSPPAPSDERSPPDLEPGSFCWSPDGTLFAAAGRITAAGGEGYGLALVRPAGDRSSRLVFSQRERVAAPSWTADGYLYFLRETSLGVVLSRLGDAAGAPGDVVAACAYDLTPDGRHLAYIEETGPDRHTLFVVEPQSLVADGVRGKPIASGVLSCPVISPDGRYVAYSLRGEDGGEGPHVWVQSTEGTAGWRLTAGAAARPVVFDPKGTRLLVELLPPATAPGSPGVYAAVVYLP